MRSFSLCVLGSGSANTILDARFADRDTVLVESGTFGGTCLNVGCIPTKMFVHPAELAAAPPAAAVLGVDLDLAGVRWRDIRDRIFGRIDPLSARGLQHRQGQQGVTVVRERVRFTGPRELETATGERFRADQVVIGVGSRSSVPDIDGLASVPYHTSDTVMRIDDLPTRCAIIGGGYIAAEFAHVFASFGVDVSVLARGDTLLRREDADVARAFTAELGRRVDVRLQTSATAVENRRGGVRLHLKDGRGGTSTLDAELLLVATGRVPNGDTLNLAAAGVAVDDRGLVVVDEFQRTTADGVFALGDCSSPDMLKHVANADARVVQHNLLHPDALVRSDHTHIPHAVFSDPQVAAVGLTEQQAADAGLDYAVGRHSYGDVAYGWAMEDRRLHGEQHFAKVVAERGSGRLLGAHLVGPHASSLIQPLIQAMAFGTPVREVARRQYWIHPALAEVVENALLAVDT